MNEKFTNSIIDSASVYLFNLQYLAQQDVKTTKELMLYIIIHNLYNWSEWFELSEDIKLKLQVKMMEIVWHNPLISFPEDINNTYYFNANAPQSLYTWSRLYDDFSVNTIDSI